MLSNKGSMSKCNVAGVIRELKFLKIIFNLILIFVVVGTNPRDKTFIKPF